MILKSLEKKYQLNARNAIRLQKWRAEQKRERKMRLASKLGGPMKRPKKEIQRESKMRLDLKELRRE